MAKRKRHYDKVVRFFAVFHGNLFDYHCIEVVFMDLKILFPDNFVGSHPFPS
jgi:hypothetical protein